MKCAPFAGVVEFRDGFAPRARLKIAVFDFDGTLSWLCHGWPDLMCEVFLACYPLRTEESVAEVRRELLAEILSNNGRPTLVQMRKFVERVQARHGQVPTPEELLHQYQSRLAQITAERSELISSHRAQADDFLVWGARAMLELLQQRGFKLYILSGTLEERVREQTDLLGVARYFDDRIFGSPPDSARFSKRAVLDKILAEENANGENLLCFGDGPVEILHTRELDGLAVAVASDEDQHGSGRMDPVKRAQLIEAGAQVVIPDYRDAVALMDALSHG